MVLETKTHRLESLKTKKEKKKKQKHKNQEREKLRWFENKY